MKKRLFKKVGGLLLFFLPLAIYAQSITGTITDANGEPLPGVNVIIKGTSQGTTTDFDGNYSINITSFPKTLVFSYVGFKSQELSLNSASQNASIVLQEDNALDEVILVGSVVVFVQLQFLYVVYCSLQLLQ